MFIKKLKKMIVEILREELSAHNLREKERFSSHFLSNEAVNSLAKAMSNTPTIWGDPSRILLGENVHLVNALLNVSSGRIKIGDDTFFGHNVSLITGTHPVNVSGAQRQLFPTEGRDIVIGNGVWIATNATILGPCSVGDNAVVAAGAVVVGGHIPANTLYGGVPAKFIRKLEPSR